MCGIAGLIQASSTSGCGVELTDRVRQMSGAIRHRGPDDSGVWIDASHGVALGHQRLSIVDLSPMGHQPMLSADGRYALAFNGEIYNHLELRSELSDVPWRGHSDTETLLAAISAYGLPSTLSRAVGMFAFALWDRDQRKLYLARDRMGEKPLYYGRLPGGDFVFGSELKALRAHPKWVGRIDRNALALYMRHNAVPAPHSIYVDVFKLRPGSWLEVSLDGQQREQVYWSTQAEAERARAERVPMADHQAVDALEAVLSAAVRDQMQADVPLGAFLSGGIDSSAVVALMTRLGTRRVRTFTIGFADKRFDEADHARAIARHLGTEHTEICVQPRDALDVIPRLPQAYDEPFADSSQIPTFLVSRLARQHVTVSLSGDGGDELFAGYNRYLLAERVWRRLSWIPVRLRRAFAGASLAVPPAVWDSMASLPLMFLPGYQRLGGLGDKVHKFSASVLPVANRPDMYRALVSHWDRPADVVLGAQEPPTLLNMDESWSRDVDVVERMCLLDQLTYLPDDILVKVDRAAMAVSLETRMPILDHRVVQFAWRVPMHQKIRDGKTKWLLRQMLYRYVPESMVERPKQGFGVPLAEWLRGPLRDWAESLIQPERLRSEGLFDVQAVRDKWNEHQRGTRSWHYQLWDVLMFQAWLGSLKD